jgi:hypothetical protein
MAERTYSDFGISPPPHHLKEDTEKPKTRNDNPPVGERSGSAIPPRPERPSEVGGLATTPTEGTETLATWDITSIFSRTRSEGVISLFVKDTRATSNTLKQHLLKTKIFVLNSHFVGIMYKLIQAILHNTPSVYKYMSEVYLSLDESRH